MDTKIRNNERFKYLHELPVTMELYNFINKILSVVISPILQSK